MGRAMSMLVITNCTGRKRSVSGGKPVRLPLARRGQLAGGGVDGLARGWLDLLALRDATGIPAADLYVGRAFADVKAVTAQVGGQLAVVSAGVGLVDGGERVPLYELTVAEGSGSVMPRLAELGASSQEWWRAVNTARRGEPYPLSRRLSKGRYKLALLALPANYIDLIADDLVQIPERFRSAVRIFTSSAGATLVPAPLQSQVLPYDERLDGQGSPRVGTRVDFAQRAMRHYVEDLKAAELPLAEGRAAVEHALSRLIRPDLPERRRVTDQDVLKLLRENWDRHGGHSSKLLRYLRDDAQVACEQSRFRALWNRARDERIAISVSHI
jgi:hypothetical protein